jgi:hypothetical protein
MKEASIRRSGADPLTSRDWIIICLLVFAAFAIRLYFNRFYRVISADGIGYVNIASDFIKGKGLAGTTHFPPLYPILVGFASLMFNDFEIAGRAVSIVMGSLIVIPVYLLGIEFSSRKGGILAAILTMSWWSIRSWSGEVMSQATYMTMALFGIYLLWIAVARRSRFAALAGGVCMALAHLTRSEGIIVYVAITFILLIGFALKRISGGGIFCLLLSWLAFWLVFSPYFILLHKLTGAWQLTGKSRMAIADGLSMYLNRPDIRMDPNFVEIGYRDLFRRYPDYLLHNISVNFGKCRREMLPLYLWALSFVGFISGGWDRDTILERGYLLATFVPLIFISVFFFIGPEYTQPYLPVLFLWAGQGIIWLEQGAIRMTGLTEGKKSRYAYLAGSVSVAAVVAFSGCLFLQQLPADRNEPYSYASDGGRFDDKRVGIRLRSIIPEGAVIMTRSGRVGFYSQRSYLLPPQAGFAEIVDYARKNRVSYLVANLQLLNVRPQLEPLYTPLIDPRKNVPPPPGFELVYMGQEPGGLPYLIYRLK